MAGDALKAAAFVQRRHRQSATQADGSFVEAFAEVVPLARLKAQDALANLALVQKGSRLSVMPVSAEEWQAILPLAKR